MANFQAHISAATITTSLAASTTLSLHIVNQSEIVALWFIGLLGGMLPDIDSDDSTSLRTVFKLFGIACALFFAMWFYAVLSIVGLWILGTIVYCLIRYALLPVFEQVTVHRGTVHSLLACLMFGLLSVHLSILCGTNVIFAWCTGAFIIMGMLTHLTLDELYSVDLSGMEFKRSFGSALKPLSLDYPLTTGAQVLLVGALIYFAPSSQPFVDAITNAQFRFLPLQDWAALKTWSGI